MVYGAAGLPDLIILKYGITGLLIAVELGEVLAADPDPQTVSGEESGRRIAQSQLITANFSAGQQLRIIRQFAEPGPDHTGHPEHGTAIRINITQSGKKVGIRGIAGGIKLQYDFTGDGEFLRKFI